MPKVIVISGPPASGKTTLANNLSAQLKLPILAKDFLKESLLDSLGYSGRERSVEIGYAAFQLHLALAREFADAALVQYSLGKLKKINELNHPIIDTTNLEPIEVAQKIVNLVG